MKKYFTIFVLLFLVFININTVYAKGLVLADSSDGNYTLDQMVSVVILVADWLLRIVGSLALVMFVYGGVIFLISAGNSDLVKKGQQIILGAIIGLALVFASHAIIQLAFTALDVPATGSGGWSTSGWFK